MNITTLTHSVIRRRVMVTMLATLALGATACGRSDSGGAAAAAPPTTVAAAPATTVAAEAPTTTAAAAAPSSAEPAAKLGKTALGPTIVGDDGLTLYAFTNDSAAASTCTGKCAEAWPPVIVPADWEVGPGLDVGIFATTTRDDGTLQLVAGRFPLYHYSGDSVPGDLNGQGSGDVWFAVNLNGTLIKEPVPAGAAPTTVAGATPTTAAAAPATTTGNPPPQASAPAPVATGKTGLGQALVTADGLTLYGLTKDSDGTPTCVDKCAQAWPPLIVDGDQLPAGLDAKLFSVVARPDGTHQLKAGKWPLYRFAGDDAPGATNGQGSGTVWFVVAPDGKLIK
jgi:predicted lipoprotein with Yx(FWY)xxD motif